MKRRWIVSTESGSATSPRGAWSSAIAPVAGAALALGLVSARAQVTPDLVSRTALRVCADPANMPFSDKQKQGFENRIADIVADQLKRPVRYLWAPSGPGFARNTLNADLCDIVIGTAVGSDVMQSTNPYYRSTYVVVAPKGSPLADVQSLDDPRLPGHRLGVFAATPPVDVMLKKGLMDKAQVYPLLVDHRFDSPLTRLFGDLAGGKIDAAIVWGPLVGLEVKKTEGKLVMSPLLKDAERPGFSYRISFGIRHDEPDWKHKLNDIEAARAADIDKVLVEFNVPLIDDFGKLITPDEAKTGKATAAAGGEEGNATGGHRGRNEGRATPSTFKMPGPAATPPAGSAEAPKAAPQGFQMPGPPPTNAPAGQP